MRSIFRGRLTPFDFLLSAPPRPPRNSADFATHAIAHHTTRGAGPQLGDVRPGCYDSKEIPRWAFRRYTCSACREQSPHGLLKLPRCQRTRRTRNLVFHWPAGQVRFCVAADRCFVSLVAAHETSPRINTLKYEPKAVRGRARACTFHNSASGAYSPSQFGLYANDRAPRTGPSSSPLAYTHPDTLDIADDRARRHVRGRRVGAES